MSHSTLRPRVLSRPTRSSGRRARAVRVVAVAALAGTLVWPATGAQAVESPDATATALVTEAPTAPVAPTEEPTPSAAPAASEAPASPVVPAAPEEAAAPTTAAVPTATAAPAPAGPAQGPAAADADTDPWTSALYGRVMDSNGDPIPGYQVIVHGSDSTTVTEPDGTWSAEGMQSGLKLIRVLVRDRAGQLVQVFWDGTRYGSHAFRWGPDQAEGEVHRGIDVTLVDNTATGTVTADGAPVAGARVSFYRSVSDKDPVRSVTAGADGTWSAGWLRPDSYAVRVVPPAGSGLARAWWNDGATLAVGTTPGTYPGIDVDLSAESRVTGRVVDEAGRPVARMGVALWARPDRPFIAAETATAADGTYTFDTLDAGTYTVQITGPAGAGISTFHPVHAFAGGALQIAAAEWTQLGEQEEVVVDDLVGRLGARVSGTVVSDGPWDGGGTWVEILDADGTVVVRVLARDRDEGYDFASPGDIPAGQYRVRGVITGGGYWWVGGNSFETARVVEVGRSSVTDVELVLSDAHVEAPPVPTVELTDANRGELGAAGPVVAGGTVTLTGLPDGLNYVWLFSSPMGLGYAQRAADGTYQVTVPAAAPLGAHRLVVTTPGGAVLGWTDVTVTAAPVVPGAPAPVPAPAVAPAGTARDAAATRTATSRTGALAVTGADPAWLGGGALALLLLGAGLVTLRRRRSA